MNRIFFYFLSFIVIILYGCAASYEEPETSIDAGRQFISAIYNGNFKRAGQLIIKDDAMKSLLKDSIEKDFRSRDAFAKEALSKASIQIDNLITKDSSTTILEFSNAYNHAQSTLLIQKREGQWKVGIQKWK